MATESERRRGRRPTRPGRERTDRRNSRNQLSREEIVEAALEIAEEEGIKAVSMRKVARRLEAGTMSLYHYVRTKDDLLALMDDAIMGEIVIPDGEMPDGWRERLTMIAKLSLAAWLKRPWLLDEEDQFRITENGMRHMDQSMGALDGIDISPALKFDIVGQVDDYLFGFAVRERKVTSINLLEAEEMEEVADFVEAKIRAGGYPALAQMFDPDHDFEEQWLEMMEEVYDERRFDRGLTRILDGIEAELKALGALPG
jgi:AcrR family transcriptional regulator